MKRQTAAGLILSALAVLSMAAQETKVTGSVRLSLPTHPLAVLLDLPGFDVKANKMQPGGWRYFYAGDPGTGVLVSVIIQGMGEPTTIEGCREFFRQKVEDKTLKKRDVNISESNDRVLLEYLVPEVEGYKIQQKNLWACFPKEDTYVDVHLSKVQFRPGEEKLFASILDTVRFEANPPADSLEYWRAATVFYFQKNYLKAIEYYEKALERHKEDQKLEKNAWRVAVDNLGMAYGLSGDLLRAKQVFEYGLSLDPTFPSFHYNLACTYAEMGDLDNAIASLKKAFEYKDNRIAGEPVPDPWTDSSFQQLLKDEQFRQFLETLVGPPKSKD